MRDLLETSLLAAVVGALAGLVAIGVRIAIAYLTGLFFAEAVVVPYETPVIGAKGWWVILIPAVGGFVAWAIVHFVAGDDRVRGSSEIVRSVAQRAGRPSSRRMVGHSVATVVSVGTGGSAGREGAMVQLGAALGNVASLLTGSSVRHRKILLAAGGAAAIGSTFNTPISGVIFAAEVILVEWSTRSFIPLVVASAMGSLVVQNILGSQPAFPIPEYELVAARELWLYILLGILCGLLAIAVLRSLTLSDRVFATFPGPVWLRPIFGGLLVGVVGFLVPEAFGVGYDTVVTVLTGNFVALSLFIILIAKILAFAITRGSGGASGAFSPSLFMGASLGGVFGTIVHTLFPTWTASAGAYALVGMAAVYAAVTRASLTAVVLLYEMTHVFSIIIPVMIAVVVADALSKAYGEGNFYRLGQRGPHSRSETDATVNILDVVLVGEAMSREVETVQAEAPVRAVVEKRFQTGHQGYPVLDKAGKLVGIITATDMRRKVKEGDLDRPTSEFMTADPTTVTPDTTVHEALTTMVRLDIGHLPVVHERDETRLVGFLTRSDVMNVERRVLDEETPGEALLGPDRLRPLFRWHRD